MRRTDRELTGISELRAILDQCDAMRIAGQDAEGFFIFPVNFGYTVEGDKLTLYFHSATEGRKARAFAQGCEIAFEMDCGHKLRTADTACGHSFTYRSVMGVELPTVTLDAPEDPEVTYGLYGTNSQLDVAYLCFHKVKLMTARLAEVENSIYRLANAIKKTQSRANALKNIIIPNFEFSSKFISDALEEKEREEFSRQKVIKRQKVHREELAKALERAEDSAGGEPK